MINGHENSAVEDFFSFVLYLSKISPLLFVMELTSYSQIKDPLLIVEITIFESNHFSFNRLDLSPAKRLRRILYQSLSVRR